MFIKIKNSAEMSFLSNIILLLFIFQLIRAQKAQMEVRNDTEKETEAPIKPENLDKSHNFSGPTGWSRYCYGWEFNSVCIHRCERDMRCDSRGNMKYGYEDINSQTKMELMKAINGFRADVAAGKKGFMTAANMNALAWDKELEWQAGCNLKRCNSNFNGLGVTFKGRATTALGMGVRWNIEERISKAITKKVIKKNVDGWYKAIKENRWFKVPEILTNLVDHYESSAFLTYGGDIRAIWADLTHIGCSYMSSHPEVGLYHYVLICYFRNWPDNADGKPLFLRGRPASKCTRDRGPDKEFPSLCERHSEEDSFVPPIILSRGNNVRFLWLLYFAMYLMCC